MAGVSISTVSLVLSKRGYVSEKTRQKVEKVIDNHSYYPRRSARHLASNRTGNFGFITSDIHLSRTEFFYSRVLLGAELEARDKDYYVLLTTVGNQFAPRKDLPRFLKGRDVDGMIIAGAVPKTLVTYVRQLDIPLVLVDFKLPSIRCDQVLIENFEGVYQAVNHLIQNGRRRIAFVGGSNYHHSIKERFRGYREALLDAGLADIAEDQRLQYLREGETSSQVGFQGLSDIMDSGADPDGFVCSNDTTAIGCLQALHSRHMNVPDDVAVVGFDDIGYAVHTRPPLTTLHVPKIEMGMQAVRILLDRLEKPAASYQTRMVDTELMIRESTFMGQTSEVSHLDAPLVK